MITPAKQNDDALELSSRTLDADEIEQNNGGEEKADRVKRNGSLLYSLSPILFSMRLCGQYFRRPSRAKMPTNGGLLYGGSTGWWETVSEIYSTVLLILLWINALRFTTIFTLNDEPLPVIINKFSYVFYYLQTALQQTAYYYASRSGRLDKVLMDIELNSPISYAHFRRLAIKFTVGIWLYVLTISAFTCLTTFSEGSANFTLAPFGIHVKNYPVVAVQVIGVSLGFLGNLAWCITMSMTFMLSVIFSSQFRCVDENLSRAIDADGGNGISDEDIDIIREQHEKNCLVVKQADRFLKIYNLAAFFGPLYIIIALLYTIAVQPGFFEGSPMMRITFSALLVPNIIQLIVTSAGGIIINHYAHEIRDRILGIKLSGLSAETIGKIIVFLDRASVGSVGLTVAGMMVINWTTVISLFGLLVTYFLLVVQFPVTLNSSSLSNSNMTTTMMPLPSS